MCKNKEAQKRISLLIKFNIDVFKDLSKDTPNDCELGSLIRCMILDEIDRKNNQK